MISQSNNFSSILILGLFLVCLLQSCQNEPVRIEFNLSDHAHPSVFIRTEGLSTDADFRDKIGIYLKEPSGVSDQSVLLRQVISDSGILFRPAVGLTQGNDYLIRLNWKGREVEKWVKSSASESHNQETKVSVSVYPKTGVVSQNILQLHLDFSEAMIEDMEAYRKLDVLDPSGKVMPFMWREKSDWSQDRTHLALMLHPGRVKRGITYLNDSVPLFQPGQSYTLVLQDPLRSANGGQLMPDTLYHFKVSKADYTLPKLLNYRFDTASRELSLEFNEAMDFGTLKNGLMFTSENGHFQPYQIRSEDDKTWFIYSDPSINMSGLTLELNEIVSDLAANRLSRLFEVEELNEIKAGESLVIYLNDRPEQ